MSKRISVFALAWCLMLAPVFAGRGTFTITNVVNHGNGSYTLTVASTTGITVGDHVGARTGSSTGPGGVWEVMSIPGGTTMVVSDTLTQENAAVAFGAPFTAEGWYSTPSTAGLSRPPHTAVAYDAALRRNAFLLGTLGLQASSSVTITGGSVTGITDLAVADGGTGSSTAAGARTNLGLVIGTDVQAYDADLAAIAALTPTKGNLIAGNGSAWVAVGVGSNGQILTADSGQAAGFNWAAAGGGTAHNMLSATHQDSDTATGKVRGDVMVVGSSTTWTRLPITSANRIVSSDGTDATYQQLKDLLDDVSSTRGTILYRNASDWVALSPGTSGHFLKTQGAGADPIWDSAAGGNHAMLSATHTDSDTGAGGIVRGDVMVVGSSTTWTRLPRAAANRVMASDGTDTTFLQLKDLLDDISATQGTVLYRNASDWVALSPGTNGQYLQTQGAAANPQWATGTAGTDPAQAGGRLSASSTDPVPTADTTSATLYYLPYVSTKIALYDGSSTWTTFDIGSSGINISVSGLTTAQVYDVFCYNSGGTPTLETLAWSNHGAGTGARATAIVRQDGVWVKSGATTRRYLGTIRTITSTGVKCTDTSSQRYVWNAQNRVQRTQSVIDTTDSWTYTTATWRQARATSTNQVEIVRGLDEDPVTAHVQVTATQSSNALCASGVGINSTSVNSATIYGGTAQAQTTQIHSEYRGLPGIGYHQIVWLEISAATGTTTWYGDVGITYHQTGMTAFEER